MNSRSVVSRLDSAARGGAKLPNGPRCVGDVTVAIYYLAGNVS